MNWDALYSQSTSTPQSFLIDINSTEYYKCFVIHITEVDHNQGYAGIVEWRLFGTPGPTTLDKGSLSLTRSLDVPRISRYDVDTETPRPEKLVVDFDTTVNESPTDISGKGNHGTFYGGASYSPADKAFTGFPSSSSNYIKATLNGASGAYAHTQSYWINGADTTPRSPFGIGKDISTTREFLNMWFTTSKWVMNIDGFGFEYVETISDNQWYHLAVTYDGGSVQDSYKFYLNGEYKTPTSVNSASSFNSLNLPSNPEVRIGRNNGTQWYNGMVSNPKIYSVALEPSEVKKLYNLGRTGRSMVISDTAVGIGKVPEAQLDVRGTARFVHAEATDTIACNSLAYGIRDNLTTPRDHTCLAQRQVVRGNPCVITFKVNYLTSWVPGILTLTGSTVNTNSSSFSGHYAVVAYRRLSQNGGSNPGDIDVSTMFSQNTAGNSFGTTVGGSGTFNIEYSAGGGDGSQDTLQITYSGGGARDVFVAECVEYSRLYY